jgi:hypothetical protein
MIYNVQGENVQAWSIGQECGEILVLWLRARHMSSYSCLSVCLSFLSFSVSSCACPLCQDALIWSSGFVVLTKSLRLYATTDINDPRLRVLPETTLEAPPVTWCVIEPDLSPSKGLEVLLATVSGTVLHVTHESAKDLVRIINRPHMTFLVSALALRR